MTFTGVVAGFVLGVLLTLRITHSVLRRARKEEYARGHKVGYGEARFLGSARSPRRGADSPAPIDGGSSHAG